MTRSEYKKQWKANRTEEQKIEDRKKRKEWKEGRSQERKEAEKLRNREYTKRKRTNMTKEEKQKEKESKTKLWHKKKALMTEQDIEKRRLEKREWYLKNRERIIKKMTARIKTDPIFKVISYARSAVRRVLKFIKKSSKTTELIGCSPSELKAHLEKQFDSKMTWENYGPYWHVDHIKPCASFDLSKPEEQRKCFHYTNLRPLEAKENLRKGSRY